MSETMSKRSIRSALPKRTFFGLSALPALLIAVAAVLGCGPGANSFNGTVAGSSLAVQRAVWNNPEAGASSISVTLSTSANVCELLKKKAETAPAFFFVLEGTAVGSYPVITDADYKSGIDRAGKVWGAFYSPEAAASYMTQGTVRLDSVTQGANPVVKGSFDVTFDADRATGTFEATPCPP